MNFMATSRRDDLISLFYLFIYLLNKNEFLGLNMTDHKHDMAKKFEELKKMKTNTSLIEMTKQLKLQNIFKKLITKNQDVLKLGRDFIVEFFVQFGRVAKSI